jgi:predicted small integral membrane protein
MQAQRIIQDLLQTECDAIHSKRRITLALMVQASCTGHLSLMGISRRLDAATALRHRIKRCDRLLGNLHLSHEKFDVYRAMVQRILIGHPRPAIIIDWSDLSADRSQHLLRAALIVKGRAMVLYEEVHPMKQYGSPRVHERFLRRLRELLPPSCRPILVTDAGFRGTWFKLCNRLKFDWIGRIRNRDMIRPLTEAGAWAGCKTLYPKATATPQDRGAFEYVRNSPVVCRLVLYKKPACHRQAKTVFGKRARCRHSLKQAKAQTEPWLLAASPNLAELDARAVVDLYSGRMQIEQSFRDVKNPRWGLGLSLSQTTRPDRLAILLLIGALAMFACWLIGLIAQARGYQVNFGSRAKAASTLSIISLARWWLEEPEHRTIRFRKREEMAALETMRNLAWGWQL